MDEELPEDEIGTNATDLLSIGNMKVDEGVRESCADLRINGTSVVPYVYCSKILARETKGELEGNEEKKEE